MPDVHLDPELAAGLAAAPVRPFDASGVGYEDLPALRKERAALVVPQASDERITITERRTPIRLRIYRPVDPPGILPCLYWIHGGGMIMGSVEADDARLVEYALAVGCVVVSVDYRLAPEHPYPAGVEDCYAGLEWTAAHTDELGIGAIAVGGASAGGGLAAATALMARDRGGPDLAFQLLCYPMLDDRHETPSSFMEVPSWGRRENTFAWTALLGPSPADVPPYAAPARATDLSGLPAAFLDVGQVDIFRDECLDYARRLAQAGVPTEFHLYPGACHGWESLVPDARLSRRAVRERIRALRERMTP
ncbi:alpha/beta hydrolase [Actinoallomurus sp. CA-150999]|uniref:alpha/beta hydrolase n=1 Tax=Actinoallomurus sp. CA-150999 TaxID=3239887 RepID=UPI003D921D64